MENDITEKVMYSEISKLEKFRKRNCIGLIVRNLDNGEFQYVDNSILKMLGISRFKFKKVKDKLLKFAILNLRRPEDRSNLTSFAEERINRTKIEILRPSKKYVDIIELHRKQILFMENNCELIIITDINKTSISIFRDITEEVKIEGEINFLKKSKKRAPKKNLIN